MGLLTLPLSNVIQVEVNAGTPTPATPTFNQMLGIFASGVNVPFTARMQSFASTTAMIAAGFPANSPALLAATAYFGQGGIPGNFWVGQKYATAIADAGLTINAAGTNYKVGDIVNVVQGGSTVTAQAKVTSITVGTGAVTGIAVISGSQGVGYADGAATTSGGSGTGLTLTITALGETSVEALNACRLASNAWYLVSDATAADADNIAMAPVVEAFGTQSALIYYSSAAGILSNVSGNIMATLQAAKYNRSLGIYTTTQSGAAPNNIYAPFAIGGLAMGLNTGLPGSFFTLKFKSLIGIIAEPLNPIQVSTIEGLNGNVYVNYANSYTWLEQGVMASGQFFDQTLNRDMLSSDYVYTIINALVDSNSIGQDDAGQTTLLGLADQCNARAAVRGYLARGTWEGVNNIVVGNVTVSNGTPLPLGYLSLSAPYSQQSVSDHQARKAMPLIIFINEAGAVHSLVISVNVNL